MKSLLAAFALFAASSIQAQDYAAWAKKNTDRSWTTIAEKAVEDSNLPNTLPTDIEKFCPAYKGKDAKDRNVFWVGLISIIARPESNFKPETTYTESFNDAQCKKVISRGLLQISIESANQKKYSCDIKKSEDLHDPKVNIGCGVKILDAWVKTDNVIATYVGQSPIGGGRYWSTLREKADKKKNHIPELVKFTRALNACSAA